MRSGRLAFVAGVAVAAMMGATSASAQVLKNNVQSQLPPSAANTIKSYFANKNPNPTIQLAGDVSTDTNGASSLFSPGGTYAFGFEGITQYDLAKVGRPNFIPPDTMGAVGKTQYLESSNGAFAVFDKTTGAQTSLVSDTAWWATAGQTGANGDNRVMYNAEADRWIAVGFGASVADLQIAVSDTSDALGGWKSTKFTGFAGGTADYPTLALDKNAVYIGTNNFGVATAASPTQFKGTTLNVIPLSSLFSNAAPTTSGLKQFTTGFNALSSTNVDNGFAIQGVNSQSNSANGKAVAASLFFADNVVYDINNAGSGAGASTTAAQYTNGSAFNSPLAAHQPSAAIPANRQIVSALDERISSSVYEEKGKIYYLTTVQQPGDTYNSVRYTVLDAATNAILDEGSIGGGAYDYFQGSLAVNSFGQLVIAYNRSGLQQADLDGNGLSDGNIAFMARTFYTNAAGKLIQSGGELMLKQSLVDDYHNGSLFGNPSAGRQRWGDYSAVSLDPSNNGRFYAIGQFAREYNLPQFGHPGGTGGSRWGTWIAAIDFGGSAAVPEPMSWAMMILGFGAVGSLIRRRRATLAA